MFPLRQTIPSEAASTMCRSSPHCAPGHRLMRTVCVCVCHRLFVIFRVFQAECEQYDLDARRPLRTKGMWSLCPIKNLL